GAGGAAGDAAGAVPARPADVRPVQENRRARLRRRHTGGVRGEGRRAGHRPGPPRGGGGDDPGGEGRGVRGPVGRARAGGVLPAGGRVILVPRLRLGTRGRPAPPGAGRPASGAVPRGGAAGRASPGRAWGRGGIMFQGQLVAIWIAGRKAVPLERVDQAEAVAGRGLVGDRYYLKEGTFSKPG